jgi:hypothetical protein
MTKSLPEGPPAHHLVRSGDPYTSLMTAKKATKASHEAILQVALLMSDGVARIDEEMREELEKRGYKRSDSTIEHARLSLEMADLVTLTGNTRDTQHRAQSREWIATAKLVVVADALMAEEVSKAARKKKV